MGYKKEFGQVYAIVCEKNKKIYVGKADKASERIMRHLELLHDGSHTVEDLQDDFNKYGIDSFSFYLLEQKTKTPYKDEEKWQLALGTMDRDNGYNYKERRNYSLMSHPKIIIKKENIAMIKVEESHELARCVSNNINERLSDIGKDLAWLYGETRLPSNTYELLEIKGRNLSLYSAIKTAKALGISLDDLVIKKI